jgi:hypothetical protein
VKAKPNLSLLACLFVPPCGTRAEIAHNSSIGNRELKKALAAIAPQVGTGRSIDTLL